ncbi:MAG: glycosyltransferase family 4 protein [Terrimicrobiaceae bacterium]|nr:glycosyltransferase family 4 protein [Terrimicrobiaceae bacterium]
MSDPLRILCLNYEYPPVGGGGGRIAHRINAALAARGHSVRVQTAGMRHLPARAVVDGVEIYRAPSFRNREDTCTVPEMALYLLTSFLPTLRHIRRWKPHVVHAHFAVPTGALAHAVSLVTGAPYVLTAHLGDVPGGVPEQTASLFRLVQPLTRPIWKRAAAVTAVSTFVADLAERAYRLRPRVILNGISLGPRPAIAVHSPPRLLMVGRLSVQKNPLLAIRALALLRDLPWEFHVAGDGPLRAGMEQEAQSSGCADRIRFLGWLDSASVAAEMSAADALLLTSLSEGLPMAAIEALDRGLAIISSRIGGVADVVEEGANGALCELTAESFAAALRNILSDPVRFHRLRTHSAQRAGAFDLDASVSAYEAVLRAASG